jgi:[ribosomal protein S5]-alanine N-acetyltransferase
METKRTIFTKPSTKDYKEVSLLYRSKQVRRFLGGPVNGSTFKETFKTILTASLPEVYWVVREKGTSQLIGLVSITKHHDVTQYEVSFELHPEYWGMGYGTEVVQRLIDYGFEELGLQMLCAETQKHNRASIRLLEKLGMKLESQLERFGEQQQIYTMQNVK